MKIIYNNLILLFTIYENNKLIIHFFMSWRYNNSVTEHLAHESFAER